jgi:hypothetical protein
MAPNQRSAKQIVAADDKWEQAVDLPVAEVRRGADDQADSRSAEQAVTDGEAKATAPTDPVKNYASELDQTDAGMLSPAAEEQQRS